MRAYSLIAVEITAFVLLFATLVVQQRSINSLETQLGIISLAEDLTHQHVDRLAERLAKAEASIITIDARTYKSPVAGMTYYRPLGSTELGKSLGVPPPPQFLSGVKDLMGPRRDKMKSSNAD